MEEVSQLEQIFPTWDKPSLLALLQANGMNLDRTVEAIFIIESAKENGDDILIDEQPSPPNNAPLPGNNNNARSYADSAQPEIIEQEFYRGLRIKLPDDFLRPPSYQQRNLEDRDAQLALMLQNEMFSEQLAQPFDAARYNGHPGRAPRPRGNSNPEDEGIPDLGIMKTLTSMGKLASNFATSLSSGTASKPQGNGAQNGRGPPRSNVQMNDFAVESSTETNPLVAGRDDDDEVISFDDTNRRSRHVLDGEQVRRGSRTEYKKDT